MKKPLTVSCFECGRSFEVKFVPPHKGYSKKNNWGYYTEKEKDNEKYVCSRCLRNLYKNKKYFLRQVSNLNKRQKLRNYMAEGTI